MTSAISLLVDQKKGQLFPFSPRGFTVTNAPVSKVHKRNADVIFLDDSGQLKQISNITLTRDMPTTRLGLWLAIPAAMTVTLTPVDMPFQTFRDILLDALKRHREVFGEDDELWWIVNTPLEEVTAKILTTNDYAELYAIMDFPRDEDCLDLL